MRNARHSEHEDQDGSFEHGAHHSPGRPPRGHHQPVVVDERRYFLFGSGGALSSAEG